MAWTTTNDLKDFLTSAGDFLRTWPDRHTVLLSVCATLEGVGPDVYGDHPPVFGWWRGPDGAVTGAFVWTPPHPVSVSPMPREAAERLPSALTDHDPQYTEVRGYAPVAEAFAVAHVRRTGDATRVRSRERLFRLGELRPPHPAPPGRARPATPDDRELLLGWWTAYRRDAGLARGTDSRLLDDRIADGRLWLWEADAGPVSMAGAGAAIAGAARVGPVYTPTALRGHGYAGAATSAVTQAALDAGASDVLLFTDLANATSNALYERLGYAPVEDHVVVTFLRGGGVPGDAAGGETAERRRTGTSTGGAEQG